MPSVIGNYYASSAMAGPGTFKYVDGSSFSRGKYPSLGLGFPSGLFLARRLRASAPPFALSIQRPETVYEVDETADTGCSTTSGSDRDSEGETTETCSVSSVTSGWESGASGCTPRLHRLIYRHRLRPYSPPAETGLAVTGGDGEREDATPGAPRIPFPPSPRMEYACLTTPSSSGVGLGIRTSTPGGAYTESAFDPFGLQDNEEAHFHLPADLFSPEWEMSSAEFVATVKAWTQRREDASL
ncbi:hypothetical protein BDY19DRAFT_992478 [Irpex rosettiformis]|uniref:Uncharacterized protein n=1 Tax=Irpex rosettiformis TaxID=378272 RepID=A0ACB8U8H0_9APHY|nr:hypothetical protein BDY19DRAFT_992478 [Irpex rosettiformis]